MSAKDDVSHWLQEVARILRSQNKRKAARVYEHAAIDLAEDDDPRAAFVLLERHKSDPVIQKLLDDLHKYFACPRR